MNNSNNPIYINEEEEINKIFKNEYSINLPKSNNKSSTISTINISLNNDNSNNNSSANSIIQQPNHLKPSLKRKNINNDSDNNKRNRYETLVNEMLDDIVSFEDAIYLIQKSLELKYSKSPTITSATTTTTTTTTATTNNTTEKTTATSISNTAITTNTTLEYKKENLNQQQLDILDNIVNKGKNVFFTGPGGTGKSYLLHVLIKELQEKRKTVFSTATTGIAALNIGGTTINSFAGIRLGNEPFKNLFSLAMGKKQNWKSCDVLIIDEVSMLDGQLFDNLEKIGRLIRLKSNIKKGHTDPFRLPWGGIQLVLSGDFYQLPPVPSLPSDPSDPSIDDDHSLVKKRKHCFEAISWSSSIDICIPLTQIFRQKDEFFSNLLSRIRVGDIDDSIITELKKCVKPSNNNNNNNNNGIIPTLLYTTNVKVEEQNIYHLNQIKRDSFEFVAIDRNANQEAISDPKKVLRLASIFENSKKSCLATQRLTLKVGAQVMLVRNLTPTLVNGSRGVVIGFLYLSENERLKYQDFIQNLVFLDQRQKDKAIDQIKLSSNYIIQQKEHTLPIVKFMNGEIEVIKPENYSVFFENAERCYRIQIPLKLAWAVTFHKIQGITLDCAQISLNKIFEHGQSYVALSRIKSLDGLHIIGDFSKKCFKVEDKVKNFYKNLVYKIDNNSEAIRSISGGNNNNSIGIINNNNIEKIEDFISGLDEDDIKRFNKDIKKEKNLELNNQKKDIRLNNNNSNSSIKINNQNHFQNISNNNSNQNKNNNNLGINKSNSNSNSNNNSNQNQNHNQINVNNNSGDNSNVPVFFLCPITHKVMENPVVAPDGYSFEKSAIIQWVKERGVSYVTKKPFSQNIFIPNRNLKAHIQYWRSNQNSNSNNN